MKPGLQQRDITAAKKERAIQGRQCRHLQSDPQPLSPKAFPLAHQIKSKTNDHFTVSHTVDATDRGGLESQICI